MVSYERGTPVLQGPRVAVATGYRSTSLARKRTPLGPYRRPRPRVLGEERERERERANARKKERRGGESRVVPSTFDVDFSPLQGYLAHKKTPVSLRTP